MPATERSCNGKLDELALRSHLDCSNPYHGYWARLRSTHLRSMAADARALLRAAQAAQAESLFGSLNQEIIPDPACLFGSLNQEITRDPATKSLSKRDRRRRRRKHRIYTKKKRKTKAKKKRRK